MADAILMRYGLPPAVSPTGRLRVTGAAAMDGDWRATAAVFRTMLEEMLAKRGP